ncbi:MAG TPA: phenylalanine--tRNA ligase subunit beta [Vicinamibacterales bacterium]
MRLVVSWLREFVDVKASADEIANTLGVRGFEVAGVERLADGDAVIDFEVTANRPDCLSVLGLAREVSTAFGVALRLPTDAKDAPSRLATLPTGDSDLIKVRIEAEDLCPRYAAAVAEVKIQPSPAWLAARLTAAGVRPISNVVDITNYVNLELGQPMHAFDLARLAGPEIRVRRAKPGEAIRTLDNVSRKLDAEMLAIADRDRAQAVAGVMGGADSEVSATTTMVVFESAFFNAVSVRKTSKRLGLRTEASFRFERGADLGAQRVAIERAAALLEQLNAGRIVGPVVDCYPRPQAPRTLHLRRQRLALLLGAAVPDADVARILLGLGLTVQSAPDGWDVVVPLFRVDLLREADLIEEVGRHYGFDRLTPRFPALRTEPQPPDARIARDQLIRRLLGAAGLSEAVTFGFIEAKAEEAFRSAGTPAPVAIANPLSAKFDTLRPSLIPGLVDVVAHNRRHGRADVAVFEIGARFATAGETRGLGIAWTGAASPVHWSAPARQVDFYDVSGAVERVCAALGVAVRMAVAREPFLVAGQTASVMVGDGPERNISVGFVGQLAPGVADERGLPRQDRVIVAELDLDALQRASVAAPEVVQPLPRYPFVVRDLSIVVSSTLPAEIIRGTIHTAARESLKHAPLVGVSFFDRYQGKGVPDGSVSLSVRLTFQSAERTLTDADVQKSFDTILAALVREHGAVQR